jgi:protein-tyrosine phosphatase
MATQLYWIQGPWSGKLALAPRPRGGDWLEDELANWRQASIDTIVSLLTLEEEQDLGISREAIEANAQGMKFVSLLIPDRQVPNSQSAVAAVLAHIEANLAAGKNVVVHCRQGIGRTGLVAACLLISKGLSPEFAIETLSAARGIPVPETTEQRSWIDEFAAGLAETKKTGSGLPQTSGA